MLNQSQPAPAFDYHVELQRISEEIETKLKAKLEAAIANLESSFKALENKLEQKLNQHIATIQASQADKATQDKHSRDLELITKQLGYLVSKVSLLVDMSTLPTPIQGVGHS